MFLLIQTVSQSRSSRLVYDTLHVETSDTTRILGRLTLTVIEISGNRDHSFRNGLAEIIFGGLLQLTQNFCANFLWRKSLAVDFKDAHISLAARDFVRHFFGFIF